jgi:hypothetical protein
MYKIIRFFRDDSSKNRTIKTGLTLQEAQAHCKDPETSSSTAKSRASQKITDSHGPWFDGYEEE